MGVRPLGVVKEIVESIGMSISYAYEDLVFLEHNGFLLQFTDDVQEQLLIHANSDADTATINADAGRLQKAALKMGMKFYLGQPYSLSQKDDGMIDIHFHPATH